MKGLVAGRLVRGELTEGSPATRVVLRGGQSAEISVQQTDSNLTGVFLAFVSWLLEAPSSTVLKTLGQAYPHVAGTYQLRSVTLMEATTSLRRRKSEGTGRLMGRRLPRACTLRTDHKAGSKKASTVKTIAHTC